MTYVDDLIKSIIVTDYVTDNLRMAGLVTRYHCWPTIQTQTIGEHSWQVALIYEKIFGELTPPVERYIRYHDVAELIVGDIPFPTKRNNPPLKAAFDKVEKNALEVLGIEIDSAISPLDGIRIKVCDLLEMTAFGMTERELGSMLAVPIIKRTMKAAIDLAKTLPTPDNGKVLAYTIEMIERHNAVLDQTEVIND